MLSGASVVTSVPITASAVELESTQTEISVVDEDEALPKKITPISKTRTVFYIICDWGESESVNNTIMGRRKNEKKE